MDERRLKFFMALQKKVEESKKLSPEVKEKFYVLAEGFIGKTIVAQDSIIRGSDLAKVYKETGFVPIDLGELEISIKDKKKKIDGTPIDLNKHKPSDVSSFLSLFHSQSHPFKYLVHDFNEPDKNFNIYEFMKIVEKKFHHETKKHSISKYLYKRLKAFIGLTNESWYFKGKKSDFSYNSEMVKSWCSQKTNKHPIFGFKNDIKTFSESIRIDGNLKELIDFKLDEKDLMGSFDIEYQNLEGATFYTDVDALLSGLGVIFNTIAQRKENSSKLKIVFDDDDVSLTGELLNTIKIIHIESKCTKKLDEEGLLSGDLKDAKRYFYELCDWSIIAENPNLEINKINILYNPSTGKKSREKTETPIEGFTHVLTFYS